MGTVWTEEEINFLKENESLLSSNKLGKVLGQIERENGYGVKRTRYVRDVKLDFLLRSYFGKEDTFWLRVSMDYYKSVKSLSISLDFVGYGMEADTWVILYEESFSINEVPEDRGKGLFNSRVKLRELLYDEVYKGLMARGLSDFPNRVRKILDDTFKKRLQIDLRIWGGATGGCLSENFHQEDDKSIIPYERS